MATSTKTRKAKGGTGQMSDAHKAALAEGREQGRTVRRYLEALDTYAPKRGRKVSPETIEQRLMEIEANIDGADPLTRLQMHQDRRDLEQRLAAISEPDVDLQELEDQFVAVAADYSFRKGLTYQAWREVGVNPKVLKRAGIGR